MSEPMSATNAYKRLKILVPAIQVLLVIATVVWDRMRISDLAFDLYARPFQEILMKLNWPLVVMWWPVASLVERFTTNMNPSATHDIWVMVYVLAILFSVAIFWYFVIVEIEARKRGGSVVRFQNALGEVAKIVFLLVSGVAAPVYAYVDWRA